MSLDFPVQPDIAPPAKTRRRRKPKDRTDEDRPPVQHGVSVMDLIEAGLIVPPVQVEREYKGTKLTARIDRHGHVQYGNDVYDSLSSAAGAARASVIGLREDGRSPPTNGWTFWNVPGPGNEATPLEDLRRQFLSRGESEAAG